MGGNEAGVTHVLGCFMVWSYLRPQEANCKRANNDSLSMWIELNGAHTFSWGSHCLAFRSDSNRSGMITGSKVGGAFISEGGHTVITSADAIYLPGRREVTSPTVWYRWGQVVDVFVCVWEWGGTMWAPWGSVTDSHHLDGSVLMNILITPFSARTCWVSSHAFLTDKYGKAAPRERQCWKSLSSTVFRIPAQLLTVLEKRQKQTSF